MSMKPLQKAKFLLCQSDFTIPDLAAEVGLKTDSAVRRFIEREHAAGNVSVVGKQDCYHKKSLPIYAWCNDFDIAYLTVVAANILSGRNDKEGREVAARIFLALN